MHKINKRRRRRKKGVERWLSSFLKIFIYLLYVSTL
jgi:cell division protein FtsB